MVNCRRGIVYSVAVSLVSLEKLPWLADRKGQTDM